MPPSVDVWFVVVSDDTDGMGPFPAFWMYSAVNLRKKLYVTGSDAPAPSYDGTAEEHARRIIDVVVADNQTGRRAA